MRLKKFLNESDLHFKKGDYLVFENGYKYYLSCDEYFEIPAGTVLKYITSDPQIGDYFEFINKEVTKKWLKYCKKYGFDVDDDGCITFIDYDEMDILSGKLYISK